MMLSKITWIALVVALCFRNSESQPDSKPIVVVNCWSDEGFLEAVRRFTKIDVPVLVTNQRLIEADQTIIKFFEQKSYKNIIRIFIDNNKFPVTEKYLLTNQKLPTVFMVKKNYLSNHKWHACENITLDYYFDIAKRSKPNKTNSLTLTKLLEMGLAELGAQAQAQAQAATYNMVSPVEGSSGYMAGYPEGYSAGYPAGYSAGYQTEGSSRYPTEILSQKRSRNQSMSPPVSSPELRERNLWRSSPQVPEAMAAIAQEYSKIPVEPWTRDLRRTHEDSLPQPRIVQRPRTSGEYTNQQATGSSQQQHAWSGMLTLKPAEKTWSPSPSPPPH